jgi:flagellar basal-body rod modification protein FlgD
MLNLIDPITSRATTTAPSPTRSLGKTEFLKLLVEQLKNQNPLEPLDGTDFTAQLAQFSSLEQLFDINSGLSKLTEQQHSLGSLEALGFVGKRVKAEGDQLGLGEAGAAQARYSLDEAAEVAIAIYDAEGKLVRTLKPGLVQKGEHEVSWDGLAEDGSRCPASTYRFRPAALGLDGQEVSVATYTLGRVSGVNLSGSEPRLIIGDESTGSTEVALSDLTEVLN